jgi:hypothetical protein
MQSGGSLIESIFEYKMSYRIEKQSIMRTEKYFILSLLKTKKIDSIILYFYMLCLQTCHGIWKHTETIFMLWDFYALTFYMKYRSILCDILITAD